MEVTGLKRHTVKQFLRYVQQRQLVLSSDECVLLVDQHEPLLHHGLLLLLVVAWKMHNKHTEKEKQAELHTFKPLKAGFMLTVS